MCPRCRMIPSSRFQSSSPLVRDRGPFLRMASKARLTSVSYVWAFFIRCCSEVSCVSKAVGRVARTEKNFESNNIHASPPSEGIPSLWSGCLDRASALFMLPGLCIIVKSNWERNSDQWACRRESFCLVQK